MVTEGNRVYLAVVYVAACCGAVSIRELLDRAAQRSDSLHALSSMLTHTLESHLPPIGGMMMPRPSQCHTSTLQIPADRDQALGVSDRQLLVLARSLLGAWSGPLLVLPSSAGSLTQQAYSAISGKIQELQEGAQTLANGLDILSGKMAPAAQTISLPPLVVPGDPGPDRLSRLVQLHFLLSCLRRDSHKIDTFIKVLRCRAARSQPGTC